MDTKRLLLVVVLSVMIFVGYNFVAQYMGWLPPAPDPAVQQAEQSQNAAPSSTAAALSDPSQALAAPTDPFAAAAQAPFVHEQATGEEKTVTVDTPLYRAVFYDRGGVLRSFELKQYFVGQEEGSPKVNLVSNRAASQAPLGLLVDGAPTWTADTWTLEGGDLDLDDNGSGSLRFNAEINGLRLVRELLFSGSTYAINEKVTLGSVSPRQANVAFTFGASSLATDMRPGIFARFKHLVFGGEAPKEEESQYNPTRVAWLQDGSFDEESSQKDLGKGELVQGKVSWMAVMNNYFMGAVSMADSAASAKGAFVDGVYHVLIGKTNVSFGPGADGHVESAYFMGPREGKRLEGTPNNLDKALDYGMFSVVARPLIWLLDFFYSYVGNYGVAIVLMTLLIKALLWPLSHKSYKSMQQMKQLQPLMVKLREKYANDKEALNREVMQLYKTYKVNPAGGCLPILAQMPIFFGLYQALLNAIELRHATFIATVPFTDIPWLVDMAAPDPLLVTPLVMGATMLLQQRMTPTPGDPTQAKIMMFMPIIFTVLFLGFPSGLVVYWLVNNVVSIGQQWWQLRSTSS